MIKELMMTQHDGLALLNIDSSRQQTTSNKIIILLRIIPRIDRQNYINQTVIEMCCIMSVGFMDLRYILPAKRSPPILPVLRYVILQTKEIKTEMD